MKWLDIIEERGVEFFMELIGIDEEDLIKLLIDNGYLTSEFVEEECLSRIDVATLLQKNSEIPNGDQEE